MAAKKPSRPCEMPSCGKWAMLDGSGFCYPHDPALADKRHARTIKQALTRRTTLLPPERRCSKVGCRAGAMYKGSGFCLMHDLTQVDRRQTLIAALVASPHCSIPPGRKCRVSGCLKWSIKNGVGYCYSHDPALAEKRKAHYVKRSVLDNSTSPSPGRNCKFVGCRKWNMLDGSGFCFAHNPATHQKFQSIIALRNPPPDRACQVKGCHKWPMKDGSGLCYSHHPEAIEHLRQRMKGNKISLGRHLPWLGLENIEEARGLIFYSLENDKPLLTLRALTKIASLHTRGEIGSVKRTK